MVLQYKEKSTCFVCKKKFYPRYCKTCSRREFGLCDECHKGNKEHIEKMRLQHC